MLKGDTQSGKTILVEVLAVKWAEAGTAQADADLHALWLVAASPTTTCSVRPPATPTRRRARSRLVWLPGLVDLAAQVGGILYLDEVNALGERVTISLHPLADHRHHFINRNKPVWKNGQFMPDTVTGTLDLWIIGTYNDGTTGAWAR